jgi:aminoglycoside phosphotransferase (APT) family kinase protein
VTGTEAPRWALRAWADGVPVATRAAWGFDHETWILAGGGRTLVVQRRSDASDPTDAAARTIRRAVRAVGLPVPEPDRIAIDDGRPVVTLPFVDGRPGSELLTSAGGAAVAGRACGDVAMRLRAVPPGGLRLPVSWASGAALLAAGEGWLHRATGLLDDDAMAMLAARLRVAAHETDRVDAVFAHGDLAPVNILVRRGAVAAVLDLDRARLAHPLFDAAWFAWVVGHHHPEVAAPAWGAFAAAAGLPDRRPAALAWLQPVQLLERLAGCTVEAERMRWATRLAETLARGGERG